MALIKSISGIRGTIGGEVGNNLTPIDISKFTSAFLTIIKAKNNNNRTIIIGRDARISGSMVQSIVEGTASAMGFDIIDAGLSTTPTVEMAVINEKAAGGIILTASHNPAEWNALKLLNEKGEFISKEEGENVIKLAEEENFSFEEVYSLGKKQEKDYLQMHIDKIKILKLVNIEKIKKQNFKVVVDGINSVGGVAVPEILRQLGVENIIEINCNPNGKFAHNPEPLDRNLVDIMQKVKAEKADLGIVIDPDVDRLAFICEDGKSFGEEYTLVAVADYILNNTKNKVKTVSNLSSSLALRDLTERLGGSYFYSAVGELNVVEKMKEVGALIGGEGNGGVIYPELHYGRDALVGIALFLSHLSIKNMKMTELKKTYPQYFMVKDKIEVDSKINFEKKIKEIKKEFQSSKFVEIDGLKIEMDSQWIQIRKSNTEPIIRIYAESKNENSAKKIVKRVTDVFDSNKNPS